MQYTKNKPGELVICIDFNKLQNFNQQLLKKILKICLKISYYLLAISAYYLKYLVTQRRVLGLCLALGLGIGIGLTVFSSPTLSSAAQLNLNDQTALSTDNLANQPATEPLGVFALLFNNQQFLVKDNNSIWQLFDNHQQNTALLLQQPTSWPVQQALVLKLGSHFYTQLRNAQLGTEVKIIASNNGLYSYYLIESKIVAKKDIGQFEAIPDTTLVLLVSSSNRSDEYFVLMAKPAVELPTETAQQTPEATAGANAAPLN